MATVGELYLLAQRSFAELARELTERQWTTRVPCCPGWDVRDVLSHVAGVPDDAVNGRLDGVASEAWTAAQVERNRDIPVDELLGRWNEQAPGFAAAIDEMEESRPPFDCHSHEHDCRHALALPGNRHSRIVEQAWPRLIDGLSETGVRLTVELADGRSVTVGPPSGPGVTLRGPTAFEVFRSRLGRRSLGQVRSYGWDGADDDIDRVVASWFNFGPATHDIDE